MDETPETWARSKRAQTSRWFASEVVCSNNCKSVPGTAQ